MQARRFSGARDLSPLVLGALVVAVASGVASGCVSDLTITERTGSTGGTDSGAGGVDSGPAGAGGHAVVDGGAGAPASGGTDSGAGGASGDGGADGGSGATGSGGAAPKPLEGLVVYTADKCVNSPQCAPLEGHVVTLDPADGAVLHDEKETASDVAYEPARDRFYFFMTRTGATDRIDLQARTFDPVKASWRTVASLPNLPSVKQGSQVVVMRDRLAYVGVTVVGGLPKFTLELYDTSVATTIQHLASPDIPEFTSAATSVIDVAAIPGNGATYGHLSLLFQSGTNCVSAVCNATLRYVKIAATPQVSDVPDVVGPFKGRARITAIQPNGPLLVALGPEGTTVTHVQLHRLDPAGDGSGARAHLGAAPNPVDTGSVVAQFGGLRAEDCSGYAFFSETQSTNSKLFLYGEGGTPETSVSLGRQGELLFFEPYTRSLLAPYTVGGGLELWAYSVADQPKLTRRTWQAPTDLTPRQIAVRRPSNFTCP